MLISDDLILDIIMCLYFYRMRNGKNCYFYANSDCSAIYCLKRQTVAMKAKKQGIDKYVSKEFLVTL